MLKTIARKAIPKIKETERIALNCGTVSLDGKIFDGTFSRDDVSDYELTDEEQQFVDVDVPHIVERYHKLGLDEAIDLMKIRGMFGLNIPKEYGGKGFTPAANSAIMTALASSGNQALTVCAMVPNSLGPAELLLHHGTREERDKYLPKLADGSMMPCFALTGPNNGSDATSNMDKGILKNGSVSVDLNKRYITLAPIADLIGLAIDVEGHGITLFLIERDHPGLEIGARHDPLGLAFPNGPIRGRIELSLDEHVLGGRDNLGRGWQLLVECLSVGRAVSLPAMASGVAEMVYPAIGAYTNARKQFKIPLWKFEAIQEKMIDIHYHTTIIKAAQKAVNGELNKGEQPAILGAMLKYQSTERGREIVNAAMDITGGVGIQEGPNNWLAESYRGMPVGITVEGANIMTRSLITFGQGMVRSHPHMQDIIDGAFYKGLGGLIKHSAVTQTRAFFKRDIVSLFAFTADCCLLLGGKLKRSEYVSGRMADFFSNVFFLNIIDDEYTLKRLRYETKELFYEIVRELPLIVRPKLYAIGKVVFFGASKPRKKDADLAFKSYHTNALTFNPVAVSGTRLKRLMDALNGDESAAAEVIQVDDSIS